MFNFIVNAQNRTLTGSWNIFNLILTIFLILLGWLIFQISILQKSIDFKVYFILMMKIIVCAVTINYLSGKFFVSRIKMYKSKGFSNKNSISESRFVHLLTLFGA